MTDLFPELIPRRIEEAVCASKDECFEALSAMKMIEKSGYAWCRPEQKKR